MKTVNKSVLIWYSAEEMYNLVTDVASYPKFLPWCDRACVLEEHDGGMTAEIGIAIAVFQALPQIDPVWRLAITVGFLGALTTFSTFSVEVVSMLQQGRWLLATGTTSLHVFGSLLLTWAGIRSAAQLWPVSL